MMEEAVVDPAALARDRASELPCGRWVLDRRLPEGAMADAAPIEEFSSDRALGRAYWLPPRGRGNGLAARSWAPLADLTDEEAEAAMDALTWAGVPAHLDDVDGLGCRRAQGGTHGPRLTSRLWVGSMHHATAEDVLRSVLLR
jgi:hypothetical protein